MIAASELDDIVTHAWLRNACPRRCGAKAKGPHYAAVATGTTKHATTAAMSLGAVPLHGRRSIAKEAAQDGRTTQTAPNPNRQGRGVASALAAM